MRHAHRRSKRLPAVLEAGSRFGKYQREQERETRKAEVASDPVLEQLVKAWRMYEMPECEGRLADIGRYYEAVIQILKEPEYSAKDVERFSLLLGEYQCEAYFPEKAGMFLSALINLGREEAYVIHTQSLAMPPSYLGCMNRKSILVKGDVGERVGNRMESGTITVNGNAGNFAGDSLNGGTVLVKGNAGVQAGCFMAGGCVSIRGDACEDIGFMMTGGEIHIGGKLTAFDSAGIGGKIYHKGKLIADK